MDFSGGVIAWDMTEKTVSKTFELILPPGTQVTGKWVTQMGRFV